MDGDFRPTRGRADQKSRFLTAKADSELTKGDGCGDGTREIPRPAGENAGASG